MGNRWVLSLAIALLAGCAATPTSPVLQTSVDSLKAQSRDGIVTQLTRLADHAWDTAYQNGSGYSLKSYFINYLPGTRAADYHDAIFPSREDFVRKFSDGVRIREVQAYYEKLFDTVDANHDSKVARDEFNTAINGPLKAQKLLKGDFDRGNREWPRDDTLSYSEFEDLLYEVFVDNAL